MNTPVDKFKNHIWRRNMISRRKRKSSNSITESQLDPTSRNKVNNLFEKKFTYSKPNHNSWKLPKDIESFTQLWSIDELMTMKSTLNNLKDKLSDKDIVKWHQHTTFMNLAGSINAEVRRIIRPELCTQAWCKFYEIVSTFNIVDIENEVLNSVHLCEAPGAFVTSLNHYLISQGFTGDWNWLGSTLNPYNESNSPSEMIDDDRFILGSYDNWDFGWDNTGNMMSWLNLQQLLNRVAVMGPVQLVTADGSINCQDNPAEQERVVSKLHYCEALASILILSPGGSLVLKKFTMFECDTICLMYLLNCLFTEVNVYKPTTSKSGNSEVYLVCVGFQGLCSSRQLVDLLCQKYFGKGNKEELCPFAQEDIPSDFVQQHISCCRHFKSLQEDTIETNLNYYKNMSEDTIRQISTMKDYCTDMYFNRYHVQAIPGYMKMMGPVQKQPQIQYNNQRYKENKRNEGTYNDRIKAQALQWEQRLLQFDTYLINESQVEWFQNSHPPKVDEVKQWACATGSPFSIIRSSRFCDNKFVQQMQEIKENCKKHDCLTEDKILACKQSAIISALDILCIESVPSSPFDVTILSTGRFNDQEMMKQEFITKVNYVQDIEDISCDGSILIIPDIYTRTNETDGESRKILLQYLIRISQVLRKDSIVIMQMSTSLTRYTAGIVYLLSNCFQKIGLLPQPGHESQLQTLICYKYNGMSHFLLDHCCHLMEEYFSKNSNSECVLLETVPILTLIRDADFVTFLTEYNEASLKSYITDIILKVKHSLPDPT